MSGFLEILLGVAALLNYSFAFMLSIEISANELLSTPKRIMWNIFVWLVPIAGPVVAHYKLSVGWAHEDATGGNNILPPGGDGGC